VGESGWRPLVLRFAGRRGGVAGPDILMRGPMGGSTVVTGIGE
jgi:hypothetical protein